MPKFKWIKSSACNCNSQKCGKYVLSIGNLYTGIVTSCPVRLDDGSGNWTTTIWVAGDSVTGLSGGGYSLDYHMDFVESRIYAWLSELRQFIDVDSIPEREIWSALYKRDDDGVLRQERLS